MENNNDKIYTLFAGVNGAGKTSIYSATNFYENKNRVNPDEILVSIGGDWRNEKDQIRAGREAVRRINSFIEQGISFNQETTLTGQAILRNIQKAKEQGFSIELYYIGLNSPELAVERVKGRVSEGGHGIPEETIKRRYKASLDMLTKVVPLCDMVVIYDNSKDLDKIAKYNDGNWTLYNEKCQWFNRAMPEIQKATNRVGEKTRETYAKHEGLQSRNRKT
ncbi:MAG: zeta toxin family protein [Catonella sp.]|uniref:zeta toxin family protein n=1 Tax=Catonella sp. TaxID=2382125 RepID=UPI003F9FD106